MPFVNSGILNFAIFDATSDSELRLLLSGTVIHPGELHNPICLIANYLFDALCHDLFQVDRDVLKEGLVSVGSKRAKESDPLDPGIIQRMHTIFKYNQTDETYYGETRPHHNNILKWYHEYFRPALSGANILVPIGALAAIERLAVLSMNGLVLLSGDKGHSNPDLFRGIGDPQIAVHGSFSIMVNYHALGVYFASRGGFALHSLQEEASLKVSAFVLPANAAVKDEAGSFVMMELYDSGLHGNLRETESSVSTSFDSI
uniref:type II protein arginine methyltransferase n=1 Tax=Hyaloperonospora arabidopsidis (strain Emoy2) TaxID=559515 RepID=M4C1T9_HYAAE